MNEAMGAIIEEYLKPRPTPPGMTNRDMVRQAIEFDDPPRIPYSFVIPFQSDFFEVIVADALLRGSRWHKPRKKGDVYYDEWGVGQKVTGREWDHAFDNPLQDLSKLNEYKFPDVAGSKRFDQLKPFVEQANQAGKYVVGFDPIMMYERMRALLGFEELMIAPYTQPDGLEALLDRLTGLTVAVIEQWARIGGVDGYMTWEDWGLQTSLQMKIETFRQYYKPRYTRIVKAAHQNGMHYIWHNCGQILDMIPDMVEIGVDVLQFDQPRLMDHNKLAHDFGGKICFWNTVDIQWSTAQNRTDDEIRTEVKEMVKIFNRFNGGFMARHYPQPRDIQLSRERCIVIYEAFLENGCKL
ncbi:MAG: hypothetical protein JRI95_11370 [Deltaproteobacteria bacterium]|nr:hypothetical protein [Deltaproteobacteria bacterium]MBW2087207.1 hypothetical protein [Deltaproteobacteria bacterium]